MKRFDAKHSEMSLVELAKPKQTQPLHELEGSIKPTPLQNDIEVVRNFQNTFLEARSPLQEELSSQKEYMEISFSKEDQDKESLNDDEVTSINDEGEEQAGVNNIVTQGGDLVPHGDRN